MVRLRLNEFFGFLLFQIHTKKDVFMPNIDSKIWAATRSKGTSTLMSKQKLKDYLRGVEN